MKDSNSPSDVAMGGDAGGGVAQLDAQIEQLVKCIPLSEAEVSLADVALKDIGVFLLRGVSVPLRSH